MKRLIIAGSRDLVCRLHCVTVASAAERFVASHWMPDIVLSGGACRGADELGEHWAKTVGIPIEKYPADWSQGRRAGPTRNALMVDLADGLVVVRGRGSRGSADVLNRAQRRGIPIVDVVLTDREVCMGIAL